MKIMIGSDHVGFPLKYEVIDYLKSKRIKVVDIGPDNPDEVVDYPNYADQVKRAVAEREVDQGILICGTGLGMSMAANKCPGIRAALCHDVYTARQARAHNDANILCMGAYIVTPQRVGMIMDTWLATPFDKGRHVPRLAMLDGCLNQAARPTIKGTQFGVALSPLETIFGPLLYAGKLSRGLAAVRKAGFNWVELSLLDPDQLDIDEVGSLFEQHEMGLSAIATGQSCLHDGLCLAHPDTEVVEATVDRLKRIISVAERFSASVIIGGIRGKFTGSKREQVGQWKQAVRAVRECARFASKASVTLLIEPINRYETNFINTVDEGLRFIRDVGQNSLRLLLDTFHMNIEERDIAETLKGAVSHLGYVHFADSNRKAPGQGHIDFLEILRTLEKIGYIGPIMAEILPLPDDHTALKQTAEFFNPYMRA